MMTTVAAGTVGLEVLVVSEAEGEEEDIEAAAAAAGKVVWEDILLARTSLYHCIKSGVWYIGSVTETGVFTRHRHMES